jgi:hypothetical protein
VASDDSDRTALLAALTAEHAVLQAAASSTVADAAQRSSLYVFALSSALVAMGFSSTSRFPGRAQGTQPSRKERKSR